MKFSFVKVFCYFYLIINQIKYYIMSIVSNKQKRQNRKDFRKGEIMMKEALRWITCPLGDVNHKVRDFERFIDEYTSDVHPAIKQYYENLYGPAYEQIMYDYHMPNDQGVSAYDMDNQFLNM